MKWIQGVATLDTDSRHYIQHFAFNFAIYRGDSAVQVFVLETVICISISNKIYSITAKYQ